MNTKKSIILVIFMFTVLSCNLFAQAKAQRYAVKSGYIEYKLGGNTSGTKKVWWDDWGNKTRTEEKSTSETVILGFKSKTEKDDITIIVNDQFWTADNIKKSYTKGTIPYYEMTQDMSEKEIEQMEKDILSSFGGEKIGSEKIMGYQCDIYSVLGTKSWIYKGLLLKTEGNVLGIEVKQDAVKFDKNIKVAGSMFEPLKNVNYKEQPSMDEIFSMYGDMYNEDDDYDEDDEDLAPLNYPYDKFQKVINSFSFDKYKRITCVNMNDQYMATFLKGFGNTLTVSASSIENTKDNVDLNEFETFNHNGKKCYYGNIEDGQGTALFIEYPKEKIVVLYMAMPRKSKQELIQISDYFSF